VTVGGLVGFAVVAILLVTTLSLAGAATVAILRERLRRAGPATERSAAAWALVAPVALTAAVVAALAIRGSGRIDHCIGHTHHAHLCLVHGAAWLQRPWAVALAVASANAVLLRIARTALRRLRTRRAIREIHRVTQPGDRVRIAPSDRVFCFVAGWRQPTVFVSSRAWSALSEDERDAVIAHEQAHAAQGDLWFGVIADVASACAAPLVGAWLHARLIDASERLCDLRAGERTTPETVASALLRMCRAGQLQHVPAGFPPAPEALERRIRAVLERGAAGSALGAGAWCLALALSLASAVLGPELHHALETLLG
jgi:beta-lactamase regulating signal transducer with metallopeptidase domain